MAKRLKLEIRSRPTLEKSKLQPDFLTKEKLAMYMQKGLDLEDAAKLCGISTYMLSVYRSDFEFEEFVQECSVKCEESCLDNIRDAGDAGMWNAAAWILERRYPSKWAKKDTIRHEYDVKWSSLVKLIFTAINSLEPYVRLSVLKKFNELDVDGEIINMQKNKLLEYEVDDKEMKGQAIG